MKKLILTVILLLVLTGCRESGAAPEADPQPSLTPPGTGPADTAVPQHTPRATFQPVLIPTHEVPPQAPPAAAPPSGGVLADLVEQAAQDLAQRLAVDRSQISLVGAGPVTWPDSSLGCPQPDMMYLMVLTPGYQVVLRADSLEYHYHAGLNSAPFFCQSPSLPAPGGAVDS